jgi:hypothetical protein
VLHFLTELVLVLRHRGRLGAELFQVIGQHVNFIFIALIQQVELHQHLVGKLADTKLGCPVAQTTFTKRSLNRPRGAQKLH